MQDYLTNLLRQMKALGASELFLTKGKSPTFRINGRITNTEGTALTHTKLALLTQALMPASRVNDYDQYYELSFSHRQPGIGRFNINIFRQQDEYALVIHALPDHVPTLDEINAPAALKKIAELKKGLVIIAGPSGMGKSTTLASLIDYRNENTASHIITIENPIEYVLSHKQSVINQREIGRDAADYESALASALRQSPDVLATNDIPNPASLEYAINFIDAGRLFFTTLNANNACHALERLANFYPENKQEQVLQSLASHTKAILAQQLIPTIDGGRTAIYELLIITPRIADLIARRELDEINSVIESGDGTNGMQSLDQSLYNLYQQKIITAETALEYASSYRNMRLRMRISSATGNLNSNSMN